MKNLKISSASYLDPIQDDSISLASSFWVFFLSTIRKYEKFSVSRWDSNRGSPDLIHDELDHSATVPCVLVKVKFKICFFSNDEMQTTFI